jgi:hypothetical protein
MNFLDADEMVTCTPRHDWWVCLVDCVMHGDVHHILDSKDSLSYLSASCSMWALAL